MAFTRDVLHFGYLADAKADIYTPTSGSNGLVHNITIHNTNTASENVQLYYHDGTNEYLQWNIDVASNETVVLQFGNEGYLVADGGKITGSTDTASKVSIKLDGAEEV